LSGEGRTSTEKALREENVYFLAANRGAFSPLNLHSKFSLNKAVCETT
jgi:hypothetical protein